MTIIDSKCTICGFMEDTPNHEIGCGAHVHDELCTATLMTRSDGSRFYLGECICELAQDARELQDQRWKVWALNVTTRLPADEAITTIRDRARSAPQMSAEDIRWATNLPLPQ